METITKFPTLSPSEGGLSQPMEHVRVRGGEDRLRPADATGRLAEEIYMIQQTAAKNGYEPGSAMDQRFQMAIGIREGAQGVLNRHGGDAKSTIKDMKSERRQAIRNRNPQAADNIDQELRILKRVSKYDEAWFVVDKLENSRTYDPESGERGLLRNMGRSALKSLMGGVLYGTSKQPYLADTLRDAWAPKQTRQRRAARRVAKSQSIQNHRLGEVVPIREHRAA